MASPYDTFIRNLHRWNEKHGIKREFRVMRAKACPGFQDYKGKVFIDLPPGGVGAAYKKGYYLAIASEFQELLELLDREGGAIGCDCCVTADILKQASVTGLVHPTLMRDPIIAEDSSFAVYSKVKAAEELGQKVDTKSVSEWLENAKRVWRNPKPPRERATNGTDDDYANYEEDNDIVMEPPAAPKRAAEEPLKGQIKEQRTE
jgi:hypothetical protein